MEEADQKSVQVTTYLPKDVHEQLKKWMGDNYQRSVSSAVSLIVEHFLQKDGRPLGNTDLVPRMAALEQQNLPSRLAMLEQQMQQLREALIAAGAISLASGVEEHLAENTSIEGGQFIYSVKEAREGLSKTEIMRRLDGVKVAKTLLAKYCLTL
ncbi:hypothetical protein H6G04_35365 [Calothrix membranacea FACHB-236]|nr:hypothetical protein [Calothrix membranacea FACHB-236]